MGVTPDRHPGPLEEEELRLEQRTDGDPDIVGAMRFVSGAFRFKDAVGVFDPRTGGSGITEQQHEILDTLTHELSESHYTEVVRSGGKVSGVCEWETSSKLKKIREAVLTRTAGKVSQVEVTQYDASGTWKAKLTGTVTRSSGKVSSIDWVRTTP
jgi:hypothetical protein